LKIENAKVMFIDTHAHIYSEEFKDDFEDMLSNAKSDGITDIYMPNIDSTSITPMMDIAATHPECHPMIGLHPCYVKENYAEELRIVEKNLEQSTFVGIGEIGIDLYWDTTFAKEQELVFRRQIALAMNAGLPFVIHSRESLDLTIDIVTEMQDGNLRGIFHCFNGNIIQAQRIIDIGFYMGIGGVITYKNAGVDKVVSEIPLEHLVLETDSPYLSPVPYRGKRNECAYIRTIAEKLADIKRLPVEEIGSVTTINANKLFTFTP
jgi:TatD DNase family protein